MPSNIPYVDEVWNPVVGCTKCSPGCDNCWAEKMARRLSGMEDSYFEEVMQYAPAGSTFGRKYSNGIIAKNGWTGKVVCDESALDKPLHWRNPRKILTCSMGDLFHPKVPFEFLGKVFDTMVRCTEHRFMVLTKRAKRMAEFYKWMAVQHGDLVHSHICPGVTICNQNEADEKIPILLSIPAAHHFISAEPMLGPIAIRNYLMQGDNPGMCANCGDYHGFTRCPNYGGIAKTCEKTGCKDFKRKDSPINFVIIGCESGTNRRPIAREHIRNLRDQCRAAGVKHMVKQMAEKPDGTGKVIHDLAWIKSQLGD